MVLTQRGRQQLDELRQAQGLDESVPWGGRSPRSLTQAAMKFRLSPAATALNRLTDEELDEQSRRHLNGT